MRAHPNREAAGVPRASVAISAYLEPSLWYDAAALAPRTEGGEWTGDWTPPPLPDVLPSPDRAREWLASEPLAGPWLARLDRAVVREPDAHSLQLVLSGPRLVLDVARLVTGLLRDEGLRCALIGSSGIFLQRPFRLSADVDLSLPAALSPAHSTALVRSLRNCDIEVRTIKTTYIFGVDRATGCTIDIEAGTAYRQPLDEAMWERMRTLDGLPVMHLSDLVGHKARMGRDKDVSDMRFLAMPPGT